MKAIAPEATHRDASDVVDELQLSLSEQRSIARMFRTIFEAVSERAAEDSRQWADDLWEGLAVVARDVDRNLDAVSERIEIVQQLAEASTERRSSSCKPKKDGAR